MDAADDRDPRYLAGVVLFNRGDYFDAHEVWEGLWLDCPPADRRFYQSLIQAAVALYHWGRGNHPGARRLFHSGRAYMAPYRPAHRGLDVDRFWLAVERRLAPALGEPAAPPPADPPAVVLIPPPGAWPDPADFLDDPPARATP